MLERMTRIQRQRELRRLAAEGGELPAAETAGGGAADPAPLLTFTPSHELSELARPLDRRVGMHSSPVSHCGRQRMECHMPKAPAAALAAGDGIVWPPLCAAAHPAWAHPRAAGWPRRWATRQP